MMKSATVAKNCSNPQMRTTFTEILAAAVLVLRWTHEMKVMSRFAGNSKRNLVLFGSTDELLSKFICQDLAFCSRRLLSLCGSQCLTE